MPLDAKPDLSAPHFSFFLWVLNLQFANSVAILQQMPYQAFYDTYVAIMTFQCFNISTPSRQSNGGQDTSLSLTLCLCVRKAAGSTAFPLLSDTTVFTVSIQMSRRSVSL